MDGLTVFWTLVCGLPTLALHLVSVTLTKSLRSYSRSRLEDLCERRGRPGRADEVGHHEGRTERAAETLAVVTGLGLAALLGVAVDRLAPGAAVESVLAIALGVSAVGYVLSGVIGRVFAEGVIDRLWPLATWLRRITSPLTFVFRRLESLVERFSAESEASPRPASVEVEIPAEALEQGDGDEEPDLPESARELLENAVALTQRDASEVMTPRSRMVMLPATSTARAAARLFHETGLSRVPVYGENHDDIVGVLFAKDLFARMTSVSDPDALAPRKIVRPAFFIPETKNASDLMQEFRERRTQIAVVMDEYGGVAGLVTLEDLVEELIGPIDDEHDQPTPPDPVVPLGGSRFEVDAALSIEELNDRLGLRFPTDEDFQTVGGLVFHAVGRVPEPGLTFRYEGVAFEIVEIADHSIRRVRLDLQPAAVAGQ